MDSQNDFFTIIAAHHKNIIGVNNGNKMSLPWPKIKKDLQYFKERTMGAVVIVGRKTYVTLPPLVGREVIIVTRKPTAAYTQDKTVGNFEDAVSLALTRNKPIFVIGGGEIYALAIKHKKCKYLDITEIKGDVDINFEPEDMTYFPQIPDNYKPINTTTEQDGQFTMEKTLYVNLSDHNSDENQYIDALKDILVNGHKKDDRTGVGTISSFAKILRFNFTKKEDGFYTFPLLTTKKMFTRGIIEELLFFLRGGIDNDILREKNVHIWDGNTSREFLDSRGMGTFEEGSLGKAYGFQWRFWGAQYTGKNTDYKNDLSVGKKYDQIAKIVDQLKDDPSSRRIILSAWNVSDLDEMALPPCHTMYIFNIQQGKLYCHLTQRSGDMFLGVPFNIASASLLTFILAKSACLEPGGIAMTIVDAHVYLNHIDACKEQIARIPYDFPVMKIDKELATVEDIENLSVKDFVIKDYQCHPRIKADMAV